MSKKKPEKVWMFYGGRFSKYTYKKPALARLVPSGFLWEAKDGTCADRLGWSDIGCTYADADRAKVALFAAGFRACQAMYAEMFKEAESE